MNLRKMFFIYNKTERKGEDRIRNKRETMINKNM